MLPEESDVSSSGAHCHSRPGGSWQSRSLAEQINAGSSKACCGPAPPQGVSAPELCKRWQASQHAERKDVMREGCVLSTVPNRIAIISIFCSSSAKSTAVHTHAFSLPAWLVILVPGIAARSREMRQACVYVM